MEITRTCCILGIAVLVSLVLAQVLFSNGTQRFQSPPVMSFVQRFNHMVPTCTNVSHEMTRGHWVPNSFTPGQLEDVESYLNYSRTYKNIPLELQRVDLKCGNINFPGSEWFRALCNPKGPTPCCWHNHCEARSVEDCRCPDCYDMRQPINAELSTWIPDNPTCQVKRFSPEEICLLLSSMKIYFVGDSLIRQFYLALYAMIEENILYEATSKDVRNHTNPYLAFMVTYFGLRVFSAVTCKGNVHLVMGSDLEVLEIVKQLINKTNTLLIYGIGFHYKFDFKRIETKYLNPMFKLLSNATWPKVIWFNSHSVGLLKTPTRPDQHNDQIQRYSKLVQTAMDKQGIPVLNFCQLTQGVMSYDGLHYGKGVNDVKVRIFLNYFLENRNYFQIQDAL